MPRSPLATQWTERVIVPVLVHMGLDSPAAVNLLLGTVAVESAFQWLAQQGGGPALGFYQIEPATARDVLTRISPLHQGRVSQLMSVGALLEQELIWNLAVQTAIARLKYYLIPVPLPAAEHLMGLARYWKTHYQAGGAHGLQVMDYCEAWWRYVGE